MTKTKKTQNPGEKKLETMTVENQPTKPETICSIDVRIKESVAAAAQAMTPFTAVEEFLLDYTTCPLCGDDMLFTHVTQFIEQNVVEAAHCESCKIKVKEFAHRLH